MKHEGPQETEGPSFYSILGLEKSCSNSEVRCAYKKLAKKWHPDKINAKKSSDSPKSSDTAKKHFQAIQEAYSGQGMKLKSNIWIFEDDFIHLFLAKSKLLSDNNKRLMYDAGVYGDDDDELEMGSFVGEITAMMSCSKKEGESSESLDELKAMFLDIINDDYYNYKEGVNDKRTNGDCFGPNNRMPMDAFNFEAKALEGGKENHSVDGDAVDSFHELKQMFKNIVDPGFCASKCSETKGDTLIKEELSQWKNEQISFEDLVAETFFPDDAMTNSSMCKQISGCKSDVRIYEEISCISSTAGDRCYKRQKLCQEKKGAFDSSEPRFRKKN